MGKIIAEMAATIAVVPLCATYLPGIHCANVEFLSLIHISEPTRP